MGTTIDAVAVVAGSRRRHNHSGRKLADAAARTCLERAGVDGDEVDLLVNAGLYHDRILGEPALAALIQEDIDANPEDPHGGGHGTFSFDVANGACGMLTGLQIADGFLRAGTIHRALVVASDADPGHRLAPDFPFAPAGAAIALSWREGAAGLAGFRFATAPILDDRVNFRSVVGFEHGRNQLHIDQSPHFLSGAAALASAVAAGWLRDNDLYPEDVDLVVANPVTAEFLDPLAAGLRIDRDRVVPLGFAPPAAVHTAGLAVGLEQIWDDGRLANAPVALLVSAGAGPTAGVALLRG
jgi:3-oxoacyl-[acyl-carrier-protein] synthase III